MTSDLVAFLRARIDEDERAATAATGEYGAWHTEDDDGPMIDGGRLDVRAFPERGGDVLIAQVLSTHGNDAAHIARHDPARVLAEVAAKRTILDRLVHEITVGIRYGHEAYTNCSCGWEEILGAVGDADIYYDRHLDQVGYNEAVTADVLRMLVQPYAGHPDFDPAWQTPTTPV